MLEPTLLIDADYFLYRAATSAEEELVFDEDTTFVVGDFKKGKAMVEREFDKLCTMFDSTKLLLTFTSQDNFRKDIDPNYKSNRTKRKPCGYKKLKTWASSHFPSIAKPRLEADDVMGILATNGKLDNFILISPDKDMCQIPCRIYNTKTEFNVTPEEGIRKLYEQALTGDSTDGYSGCVGVGPKKAGQILSAVTDGDYWSAVRNAFIDAEMTEEDALRNLRLARILQVSDWDAENQTPILYTP